MDTDTDLVIGYVMLAVKMHLRLNYVSYFCLKLKEKEIDTFQSRETICKNDICTLTLIIIIIEYILLYLIHNIEIW